MADKTEAQKSEEAEAKRRAALTQAERDEEDLRNVEELQREENARMASGQIGQSGSLSRDALVRRIQTREKAERDKLATVEVIIAPGREVYIEANQAVPYKGGVKVMVTPDEELTLRKAGHLIVEGVREAGPAGPKVYQEAGLLQGHAPGQGAKAASGAKASTSK